MFKLTNIRTKMNNDKAIKQLQSEVAALKTIITSILKTASDEQINLYVKEVSMNPIHEIAVSDQTQAALIQNDAQRIARSLVEGIKKGRM